MAKSAVNEKPNFGGILSMPAQDAERPPTLPRGYYVCSVRDFKDDKSSKQQTPFTRFNLEVLSVWEKEGVMQADEDEIEEFGDVKGAVLPVDFYHTEKSIYRLKEFLEHCGVDLSDGKSFSQAIPETRNCQIVARVTHQTSQDGSATFARVSGTAPVEE